MREPTDPIEGKFNANRSSGPGADLIALALPELKNQFPGFNWLGVEPILIDSTLTVYTSIPGDRERFNHKRFNAKVCGILQKYIDKPLTVKFELKSM